MFLKEEGKVILNIGAQIREVLRSILRKRETLYWKSATIDNIVCCR